MAQRIESWRGDDGALYESEELAKRGEQEWAQDTVRNHLILGVDLVAALHAPEFHKALRIIIGLLPPEAGIVTTAATVAHFDDRMPPPLRADEIELSADEVERVMTPMPTTNVKTVGEAPALDEVIRRTATIKAATAEDLANYGGDTLPTTAEEAVAIDPTRGQPGPAMPVHNEVELPMAREFAKPSAPFSYESPVVPDTLPMSRAPDARHGQVIDDDERSAIAGFSRG